jgi:hypothetical protein
MYQALVEKKTLKKVWDLPKPEAITPENIDEYDWQNWSWL